MIHKVGWSLLSWGLKCLEGRGTIAGKLLGKISEGKCCGENKTGDVVDGDGQGQRVREEPSKAPGPVARMNLVCIRNRICTGAWQARGTAM